MLLLLRDITILLVCVVEERAFRRVKHVELLLVLLEEGGLDGEFAHWSHGQLEVIEAFLLDGELSGGLLKLGEELPMVSLFQPLANLGLIVRVA